MTVDDANTNYMPSSEDALPPLPAVGEYGPHVCEIVSLYLAVLPDLSLTSEQTQILAEHIRICAACAEEQHVMNLATYRVANLGKLETAPSARVDQAVMAAINARRANSTQAQRPQKLASVLDNRSMRTPSTPIPANFAQPNVSNHPASQKSRRRRVFRLLSQLAVAAVILLAVLATMHFVTGVDAPATAFALPANLSWNSYVLYHTETDIDGQGERYQVDLYHDLDTGQLHVETIMPGQMDVVVVSAGQHMLGKDMMNHVAQMDPQGWDFDDSVFDLVTLKSDLQAKRAVYLDIDTFRNQSVYRIRLSNGLVLLLNMHYQPVNVLRGAVGPGTGEPIYDTLKLLPTQQVPDSTWSMTVPTGFQMGTLPPKP